MAEKATFEVLYHKIIAVGGDQSFVGVGPIKPPLLNIHIDATIYTWVFKPQPEPGVFRLSLRDSYPYTGVEGKGVVATIEAELDKEWRINFRPEFDAFTIELNSPIIPALAWTVFPDKQIVLEPLVRIPLQPQLFKINPAV